MSERKLSLQELPQSAFEMDCLELHDIINTSLSASAVYRQKFRWENNLKQLTLREFLKNPVTRNVQHFRTTGSAGSGKAQPLTSCVATPDGWVPMGDVLVGQIVFARDGKAYPVTGVFPQGVKQVFKVTFKDGSKTRCCADHLWVLQKTRRKHADVGEHVIPLREAFPVATVERGRRWKIPLCQPLQFSRSDLPLHPYLLGALLGNGCLHAGGIHFSAQNRVLAEKVASLLPEGDRLKLYPHEGRIDCDYAITAGSRKGQPNSPDGSYFCSPTRKALRALSLEGHSARTKFIPRAYLLADEAQRRELLAGILDTDGYACPGGGVELVTASAQLAFDVTRLVQMLGGVVTERRPKIVDGWSYVRLNIALNQNPFTLKGKHDAWVQPTKYPPSRVMVSAEPDGEEECQCISVASPDSTYLTDDFIVTHNTWTWIAWFYELQEAYPGCSILAMRNTHAELMTALYQQIKKFYLEFEIKAHYRESKSSGAPIIELPNGSKWVFWSAQSVIETTGADTARGLGGSEFSGALLEECDVIPQAAVNTVTMRLREKSGVPVRVVAYADNPTHEKHWLHKLFNPDLRVSKANGNSADYNSLSFYVEDNRKNLPPGYIESLHATYRSQPALYRRFVLGQPGPEITGTPIYGSYFNQDWHVAKQSFVDNWVKQKAWEDGPLCLSMDFGFRHPSMVVMQDVEIGRSFRQLRFLAAWLGDSTSLGAFTEFCLDLVNQNFPNAEIKCFCDPQGANKDPRGVTEETAIDVLRSKGLTPFYKKSSIVYGVNLVIQLLQNTQQHEIYGVQPSIVIEPRRDFTGDLIDMFQSGYTQQEAVKKDVLNPVEDAHYIHIADAARYGVIHRRALRESRRRTFERESYIYSRDANIEAGLYLPEPEAMSRYQGFGSENEMSGNAEASYFGGSGE